MLIKEKYKKNQYIERNGINLLACCRAMQIML